MFLLLFINLYKFRFVRDVDVRNRYLSNELVLQLLSDGVHIFIKKNLVLVPVRTLYTIRVLKNVLLFLKLFLN